VKRAFEPGSHRVARALREPFKSTSPFGAVVSSPAIEIEGLRVEYGDVTAVADCSLTVPEGALFGLLGPNGSGKTTTLDVLTGQRTPTAGRVRVLGVDPVAEPVAVRERIGIVPEGERPPSFMTPREYFRFVGDVRGVDGDTIDERTDEWAERLLFAGSLDTLTTDLSKGQKQKVMLTAAFLHEPALVFIDEPLVNLDPVVQERVIDHCAAYHERGNTLVLSTHFVDVAERLCTDVAILVGGEVVARLSGDETADLRDRFLDAVDAATAPESASARGTDVAATGATTDRSAADGDA
jgi:ABC-2 type transport system ATP-binding protein